MSRPTPSGEASAVSSATLKVVLGMLVLAASTFPSGISGRAQAAETAVSGTFTVDGKKIALAYAYLDRSDPTEPIVVLSNKPLPAAAIPFIPEKLIKDQKIYAIAFSVSQKDRKLSNTYGMLSSPGDATQVGLGRVEEGEVLLSLTRLDDKVIEGKIATAKPVTLSYISYSFDLSFKAAPEKRK
jgi:hypothetical protein